MGLKVNQYSTRLITRGSSVDGETVAINIIFLIFMVGVAKPFLYSDANFDIATCLFGLMVLAVTLSIVATVFSMVRDYSRSVLGWLESRKAARKLSDD